VQGGYPSLWVILHIQESRNKGSLCRVVVYSHNRPRDSIYLPTQHNSRSVYVKELPVPHIKTVCRGKRGSSYAAWFGSVDTKEVVVEWLTRLVACAEMAVGENGPARDGNGGSVSAQTHGSVGPRPRRLGIHLASRFDPKDVRLAPARCSSTEAGRRTRRMSVAGKAGHRREDSKVTCSLCGECERAAGWVKRRGESCGR